MGDGPKERLVGAMRGLLAPSDRRKRFDDRSPRLVEAHGPGIAHDLPDMLAAMLALDEKLLAARRRHADAEAPDLASRRSRVVLQGFSASTRPP